MTLEEAIKYYVSVSKEYEEKIVQIEKYTEEYRQLAEWLMELKKYREKDRYNNYDVCLGGFHDD